MSKIVKIYHYNSKLTKLADIMDFERIYGVSEVDFLNFKDERGVSNRQKAFDINQKQYVNIDKIESAEQLDANSTFYSPIIFALPSEYVSTEILISESTLQIPNDDYKAFLSLEILKIINSPYYKNNFVNRSNPRISVWIWSKTLNNKNTFSSESIINITPFVQDINVSNNLHGGGNFSINLAPVLATMSYNADGDKLSWGLDKPTLSNYIENGEVSVVAKSNVNIKTSDGTIARSSFLFSNIISENDVVFIKFETPDNVVPKGNTEDFYLDTSNIANQNWDMIGLVDRNTTQTTPTDITSQVTGRDLMKLLIEDGSYFFGNSYSNPDAEDSLFKNKYVDNRGDRTSAFNNIFNKNEASSRMFVSGMIDGLWYPQSRTIEFIMNLLIRTLSNVEICPSDLFQHVKNKTVFQYESSEIDNKIPKDVISAFENQERE